MKEVLMNKLQGKKALFWLDGVLPIMPILTFVLFGIIAYNLNLESGYGWFAVLVPISFSVLWGVWHYAVRSKLNIIEKQPWIWRFLDKVQDMV